jgi:hypothetical protein
MEMKQRTITPNMLRQGLEIILPKICCGAIQHFWDKLDRLEAYMYSMYILALYTGIWLSLLLQLQQYQRLQQKSQHRLLQQQVKLTY